MNVGQSGVDSALKPIHSCRSATGSRLVANDAMTARGTPFVSPKPGSTPEFLLCSAQDTFLVTGRGLIIVPMFPVSELRFDSDHARTHCELTSSSWHL